MYKSLFESRSKQINTSRAKTELFRFNIVNSSVADTRAPCAARTSAPIRVGTFLLYTRKDFYYLCDVSVDEWYES